MREKIIIEGKVEKKDNKKFKIKAYKSVEIDADIEIIDEGNFQVDKLSVDTLPTSMTDGTPIKWLNHFSIKKGNNYIKQPFKVTIAGLGKSKKVVIVDTSNNSAPYYFKGQMVNDTIELSDGDPGIGQT